MQSITHTPLTAEHVEHLEILGLPKDVLGQAQTAGIGFGQILQIIWQFTGPMILQKLQELIRQKLGQPQKPAAPSV